MTIDEPFVILLPTVVPSDEPRPITHGAHMRGDPQVFNDNLSRLLTEGGPDVVYLRVPVEPHNLDDLKRVLDGVGGASVERIEHVNWHSSM